MKGSLKHEYDAGDGKSYDLLIVYDYVPYTPAVLTADPYYSEPEDGGYCEDMVFKVIGYREYDEEGAITLDWPVLTPEREFVLTIAFNKMVNNSVKLLDYFQKICTQEAERAMEPDYD